MGFHDKSAILVDAEWHERYVSFPNGTDTSVLLLHRQTSRPDIALVADFQGDTELKP